MSFGTLSSTRVAMTSLAVLALALGSALTAMAGKPVKPPKDPAPDAFSTVFYDVDAEDLTGEDLGFWPAQIGPVIGRIEQDDSVDRMLINQSAGGGAPPKIDFGGFFEHFGENEGDCSGSTDDQLDTCFPSYLDEQYRTVIITRADNPNTPDEEVLVTVNWMALNIRDANQFYVIQIDAVAIVVDENTGEILGTTAWDPLGLVDWDSQTLQLGEFAITGKGKNACVACGSFEGAAFMTVTRRAGPLPPVEE